MNRERAVELLNTPNTTTSIIREYCLHKGKDPELIKVFLELAELTDFTSAIFRGVLDNMNREFNLTILKDTNNNIIKIL